MIKYSPETNLLIYFKFISNLKLNSDFLKSKIRKKMNIEINTTYLKYNFSIFDDMKMYNCESRFIQKFS